MAKLAGALVIGVMGLALVGGAAAAEPTAAPASARKHSGTVVKVDPAARTLVVRELVEGGKAKSLDVKLTPQTRFVLSERLPAKEITDLKQPFRDTAIDLGQVQPGDIVVVDAVRNRGTQVASQVTVTWRPGTK